MLITLWKFTLLGVCIGKFYVAWCMDWKVTWPGVCMYIYRKVTWLGVCIGMLSGLVYLLESYVAWCMFWKVMWPGVCIGKCMQVRWSCI